MPSDQQRRAGHIGPKSGDPLISVLCNKARLAREAGPQEPCHLFFFFFFFFIYFFFLQSACPFSDTTGTAGVLDAALDRQRDAIFVSLTVSTHGTCDTWTLKTQLARRLALNTPYFEALSSPMKISKSHATTFFLAKAQVVLVLPDWSNGTIER